MIIPNFEIAYSLKSLLDGANAEMNVDGSSANKIYSWQPLEDEVGFLEKIFFFILDPGIMSHNTFGSLASALTNGVDVIVHKNCCDDLLRNLKDNVDIKMSFNTDINIGGSNTAFLNDEDYFSGSIVFHSPIALRYNADDNDCVKIIVKDNLTNILRMRSEILIRKDV